MKVLSTFQMRWKAVGMSFPAATGFFLERPSKNPVFMRFPLSRAFHPLTGGFPAWKAAVTRLLGKAGVGEGADRQTDRQAGRQERQT